MRFTPFPIIITERLVLRKIISADAPEILFLRSDPVINEHIKRDTPKNIADAEAFIQKITKQINEGISVQWGITLAGEVKIIGSICIWNFLEKENRGEIGYDLNPQYQRKGIMNEALNGVLKYGFEVLQLAEMEAYTSCFNKASKALLAKNGFNLRTDRIDEENLDNRIFGLKVEDYLIK